MGKGSVTSLSIMFVVNILIVDRQTSSLVFDTESIASSNAILELVLTKG